MSSRIVLVTDSTSMLSEDVVQAHDITVVPLQVVVDSRSYDESTDSDAAMVADELRAGKAVSTSRPTPQAFLEVYEGLAREGAEAIVSVHLSGEISGTCESAQLAARDAPVPVEVVDSRLVGVGTGFAVLAAAEALASGADAPKAADAARRRAAATTSLFYVDTLDDGRVVPLEKVRTAARALGRLEELAIEAAGSHDVDVAVAHLANPERAEKVAANLKDRIPGIQHLWVGEVGAVIGAHVGPGMVAVVIAPRV
jgi:fatty acid-binding protein DegV